LRSVSMPITELNPDAAVSADELREDLPDMS
jgi:hypothetical protein